MVGVAGGLEKWGTWEVDLKECYHLSAQPSLATGLVSNLCTRIVGLLYFPHRKEF